MEKMRLLENKKIFVFGGSGLIGKSIIKTFLSNNANVINLDIKKFVLKNKKYKFLEFDITDIENLNSKLNTLVKNFGIPDVIINSSYPRTQDWALNNFKNIKLISLQKNVDNFLISSAWIGKFFADKMSLKKNGSIIFLGSIYSKLGQNLDNYKGSNISENYSYSIIKGGMDNAARQLASYYGRFNVRVNNLCPGSLKSHVAGVSAKQSPKFVKKFTNNTPLRRLGRSNEIANVALFLASDLSSYITGQSIYADGGYTII